MTEQTNYENWQEKVYKPAIKKFPERKAEFFTDSGIHLSPVIPPSEIPADREASLGYPAQYTFTRGVQPTMYRGGFGPCDSTPVIPVRKNQTGAIAFCLNRVKPGSQ
jgi:methylmalonyl-CoA mutase N-terminal domain/subunit